MPTRTGRTSTAGAAARRRRRWRHLLLAAGGVAGGLLAAGCGRRLDMYDQPRYKTMRGTSFFADGKSARDLVPGTVPRGWLREDGHLHRGMVQDTTLATTLPLPLSLELVTRGQERYEVHCTPCHDYLGTGRGMVVRRGFKQPPSFHQDRLRQAPVGYLFDVMTNGFGVMSSYASQVPVEDRWAIAAYVRALQLSQNTRLVDLPPADKQAFERALHPPAATEEKR